MNISKDMAVKARKLALKDKVLRLALEDWFSKKGSCPDPEITDFNEWVEKQCNYIAKNIGSADAFPTPKQIVVALKVNAVGDELALYLEKEIAKKGFPSDINCYVEEGIVYASIWLKGGRFVSATKESAKVAAAFRKAGYAAEVWVDEEDDREVTVNAQLDFPLYFKGKRG